MSVPKETVLTNKKFEVEITGKSTTGLFRLGGQT